MSERGPRVDVLWFGRAPEEDPPIVDGHARVLRQFYYWGFVGPSPDHYLALMSAPADWVLIPYFPLDSSEYYDI
jgi:hypothetical protein